MVNSRTSPVHQPVLADEVVRLLVTDRDGAYFDLTVGTGGHLQAIAQAVTPQARLYGMDIDPEAAAAAARNLHGLPQVRRIITGSYREFDR
ncbi:MAG: 16S rRNA (cytosine(1402)-N(4))-methyltransferase, partial [Candidatus Zixiibacteriota bacterium]